MPWHRNDRDPLEAMRRKLAEQERQLARELSRLQEELARSGEPPPVEVKVVEPPVWRMEEDGPVSHRAAEPAPSRKRDLARQRQRDMMLFFILIAVLLLVAGIAFWIAYVRNMGPING